MLEVASAGAPGDSSPAQHISLAPLQVCKWLRAATASTPMSSVLSGRAPTCLHQPPLQSAMALFSARRCPVGTPGLQAPPGLTNGSPRANHSCSCPTSVRGEQQPLWPQCCHSPSLATTTSRGSTHSSSCPAQPTPWGHPWAVTSPQATISPWMMAPAQAVTFPRQ